MLNLVLCIWLCQGLCVKAGSVSSAVHECHATSVFVFLCSMAVKVCGNVANKQCLVGVVLTPAPSSGQYINMHALLSCS